MNYTQHDEEKNNKNWIDRLSVGWVLIIGLLLAFAAPFIFTRSGIIDFSKTGQIGDTIGGITSPIIGLLSAFLVYRAFQEQVNANRILNDDLQSEKQLRLKESREKILKQNQEFLEMLQDQIRYLINNYSFTESIGNGKFHYYNSESGVVDNLRNIQGYFNYGSENYSPTLPLILDLIIQLSVSFRNLETSSTYKKYGVIILEVYLFNFFLEKNHELGNFEIIESISKDAKDFFYFLSKVKSEIKETINHLKQSIPND